MGYWGGGGDPDLHEHAGAIKAIDPMDGHEVWSWAQPFPLVSSVLSTAGGLVLAGTPSGQVVALNARDGKLLWSFEVGSGVHSSPVTYSVWRKTVHCSPVGMGRLDEGIRTGAVRRTTWRYADFIRAAVRAVDLQASAPGPESSWPRSG